MQITQSLSLALRLITPDELFVFFLFSKKSHKTYSPTEIRNPNRKVVKTLKDFKFLQDAVVSQISKLNQILDSNIDFPPCFISGTKDELYKLVEFADEYHLTIPLELRIHYMLKGL